VLVEDIVSAVEIAGIDRVTDVAREVCSYRLKKYVFDGEDAGC
jgi:hypothetical protein